MKMKGLFQNSWGKKIKLSNITNVLIFDLGEDYSRHANILTMNFPNKLYVHIYM